MIQALANQEGINHSKENTSQAPEKVWAAGRSGGMLAQWVVMESSWWLVTSCSE